MLENLSSISSYFIREIDWQRQPHGTEVGSTDKKIFLSLMTLTSRAPIQYKDDMLPA